MTVTNSRMEALRAARLAERQVTRRSSTRVAPAIQETVTVTPLPSTSRTHLLSSPQQWGWSEIRDYVVSEIEARWGAFPRDSRKEASIFKRWCKAYGDDAHEIAKYAFEVCDGSWKGAPISINRFCKGSDEWFSDPILDALRDR